MEENYLIGSFFYTSLPLLRVLRWLLLFVVIVLQLLILGLFYDAEDDQRTNNIMKCKNIDSDDMDDVVNSKDVMYSLVAFVVSTLADFIICFFFRPFS